MVAALAREGGLPSTLWAGPEQIGRSVREGRYPVQGTAGRRQSVALKLGFGEDDFGRPLIDAIAGAAREATTELTAIELTKDFGETTIVGQDRFDGPPWVWPKR
jgi:hypothetical protein